MKTLLFRGFRKLQGYTGPGLVDLVAAVGLGVVLGQSEAKAPLVVAGDQGFLRGRKAAGSSFEVQIGLSVTSVWTAWHSIQRRRQ